MSRSVRKSVTKSTAAVKDFWGKYGSMTVLFIALIVAIAALWMAIVNKEDIDDLEDNTKRSPAENFCGGTNHVQDGYDSAHNTTNGHAQANGGQCGNVAVPEPHNPAVYGSSSQPSYTHSSQAYHADYPDGTDAHSLAGKNQYGCAPDNNNTGNCDYAMNPDNLMPGSWRDGTDCPDGSDPNSQWAKYAPTKEAYWRYITAAGSARLGVNTRIPWRIVGTPLLLRSGVSVPITHSELTPFNGSSWRQDILADSLGYYPQDLNC